LVQLNKKADGSMISAGCTFAEDQHELFLHIKQSLKVSEGKYQNGYIDVTANVCEMTAGANNLLAQSVEFLMPNFRKNLKDLIHPCPYLVGKIGVNNFTVKNSLFRGTLIPGEYKLMLRYFNEKNQTINMFALYSLNT
jgi:hypothetical protein